MTMPEALDWGPSITVKVLASQPRDVSQRASPVAPVGDEEVEIITTPPTTSQAAFQVIQSWLLEGSTTSAPPKVVIGLTSLTQVGVETSRRRAPLTPREWLFHHLC